MASKKDASMVKIIKPAGKRKVRIIIRAHFLDSVENQEEINSSENAIASHLGNLGFFH